MSNQSLKKNLFTPILLLIAWTPIQAVQLNKQFALGWYESVADALIQSILFGLMGFSINSTFTVFQSDKKKIPYFILGVIAFSYAASAVAELIIPMIADWPTPYIKDFHNQRLIYSVLIGLFLFLVAWAGTAHQVSTEEEQRRLAIEKIARDAELASLRQQLQPHFLFNSLNSINALIGTQPEKARQMVQQLSDFLRGTVKKDDNQLVPLFEELQQLRLYLDIEKVRFGHRLSTAIENDNGSLNAKLPPLLVQPVVENAIKFGLYDTIGETVISIKTKMDQNNLLIEVENPFDETTSSPRHGTGFGLSSLQRRLYLLYARNDLLTTKHENGIFKTIIRIPQQ